MERDHPREVDPDVVLVELDEVKVHAQAHTGRKQILALTAVVMIAGRCWHLAAATTPELAYQVGALLAVLGVHRGTRRLLVLADGARWIRDWFEGLGVERRDDDRVLVAPGEALSAGPEPGLPRSRAPPGGRVGGAQGVVARAGR